MFNLLLITAVFCYFHMLFLWALKNVEIENDFDRTAFLSTNSFAVKDVLNCS